MTPGRLHQILSALLVERFGWAPRSLDLRYEDDEYLAGVAE